MSSVQLRFVRGDTLRKRVRILAGGTPVDVSGWTFSGQARLGPRHDDALAADFAIETVDGTNALSETGPGKGGEVDFVLTAVITQDLPDQFTWFDFQAVTDAGDKVTVVRGRLTELEDRTRP